MDKFKIWSRLLYIAYVVIPAFPVPFTWFIWLSDVEIGLENPDNYLDGYRWDAMTKPFGVSIHLHATFSISHTWFYYS